MRGQSSQLTAFVSPRGQKGRNCEKEFSSPEGNICSGVNMSGNQHQSSCVQVGLKEDDYLCKGLFHGDQDLDSVGTFLVKVWKYLKCRRYIVPVTE